MDIMNKTPLEPVYQLGAPFVALVPKHLNPTNKGPTRPVNKK